VLAISLSLLNGWATVGTQRRDVERISQENKDRLNDLKARAQRIEKEIQAGAVRESIPPPYGPRHPVYAFAWGPQNAALPPAPLAVLSVGETDLNPIAYEVSTNVPLESFSVTEQTAYPLKMLIGHFDYEFVVVYLLPLFIIAVPFNLISEERENGTLNLVLSQPISLRTLLLAKLGLRIFALFGVVLLTSGVGLAALGLDWHTQGMVPTLAVCCFAVIAYGLLWFAMAALVNLQFESSTSCALALASCWVLLVFLFPSFVNLTANTAFPMPSRVEFVNVRRALDASLDARKEALISRFFAEHPEHRRDAKYPELGKHYIGRVAGAEEMERQLGSLRESFRSQMEGQRRIHNLVRPFSVVAQVRDVLREASGSGRNRYQRFLGQIRTYQGEWRKYFWGRAFLLPPMSSTDYDGIPRFTFQEESLSVAAQRSLPPCILLISWIATAAFVLFRRV
jgi:ABC-2 type transport system permease protein